MKISKTWINISSLLVAFSGMIYELGLAQILSATLGGTVLRYSVTIGLFTATLGLGALAFDFLISKFSFQILFPFFQKILAWIGFLSPLLLITIKSGPMILSHLPIIAIGFISGIELPLLMHASKQEDKNFVLAYDYIGMFVGTLLFPLFLLPHLGVISTLLLASAINALVGISYLKQKSLTFKNISIILVLILDVIALFNQERILVYASQLFI